MKLVEIPPRDFDSEDFQNRSIAAWALFSNVFKVGFYILMDDAKPSRWKLRIYSEDGRSEILDLIQGGNTCVSELSSELARILELPRSKSKLIRILIRAPYEQRLRGKSELAESQSSHATIKLPETQTLGDFAQQHDDPPLTRIKGVEQQATIVVRNAGELGDRRLYAALRSLESLDVRLNREPRTRASLHALAKLIERALSGKDRFVSKEDESIRSELRHGDILNLATTIGFVWQHDRFSLPTGRFDVGRRGLEKLEPYVGKISIPTEVVKTDHERSTNQASKASSSPEKPSPPTLLSHSESSASSSGAKFPLKALRSKRADDAAAQDYSRFSYIVLAVILAILVASILKSD